MRILLVDQNSEYIHRMKDLLSPFADDYVLESASNFQAAATHLQNHPIDSLLICDDAIPEGQKSIQYIHTIAPRTAIVVILSSEDEAAGEATVEMGAQDYISEAELNRRTLRRVLRQAVERKQHHESLQQAQERLRVIFESVQDYAIFSTDENGYINTWNIGAERQFGYTEAEIIGQRADVLFTPEDRAKDAPQGEINTASEKGAATDERWHLRKDGSRFFASGMMRPLRDPNDRICGFAKVCRDITERKQFEDELSEMVRVQETALREAERANQLRDMFVGVISHELRSPLTSVIGFVTTLMAEDVQWSETQVREFIEIIYIEAERMNQLIAQLLDVAQQQSGMLHVNPNRHNLAKIVKQAMPQLQTLSKNHKLTIEIPSTLPELMLDADRIVQVLVNLVGNATKFSPVDSPIRVVATAETGQIKVSVSDQGAGIPSEHAQRIFEAFHQGGIGERRGKGIGLGLTISKGIVEAHGGHIWFETNAGQGTTFCFTLPLPGFPF